MSALTLAPPAASPRATAPAPPASARAGRRSHHLQTLLLAGLGVLSGVLLVWQLDSGDLVGTLAGASTGWVVVAVAASLVPLLGAAVSLAAFAPGRLPLGRTIAVQVASSYAGVVLPPTVGQLAVNTQYLRRLGHAGAAVTTTLALTEASSLVVGLFLLAAALTTTSATLVLTGSALTIVLAVVLLTVALALVLLLVPGARRRVTGTVTATLREVRPRLYEVASQPARLAAGIGGNLLLTGGSVVTLDAPLRAVDTTLPLAQIAILLLAGTALGSAAPTPGGMVAVEAALTGGLLAAGVPASAALPAVLLYRAITLWLRVAPGWVAMTVLRRRAVL